MAIMYAYIMYDSENNDTTAIIIHQKLTGFNNLILGVAYVSPKTQQKNVKIDIFALFSQSPHDSAKVHIKLAVCQYNASKLNSHQNSAFYNIK